MRKCVSPRLDLGNFPSIIKSQVPQVNWMTFVSPFFLSLHTRKGLGGDSPEDINGFAVLGVFVV